MTKILLLLSGGIDSTCAAAIVEPDVALCIDYGQVCAPAERLAASRVASIFEIEFAYLTADCSTVGTGDLSRNAQIGAAPVPEWWPFRNQLLAKIGGAFACANGYGKLVFATVASDAVHVDGTPEFFRRLNSLMEFQEGGIQIVAPLIQHTSEELVRMSGLDMSVLASSHSCHVSNIACGRCRGCTKRAYVLRQSGLVDDHFIC